jgi:phosphoglycerol transferase MdoB-like AlkP superfamily enzyme
VKEYNKQVILLFKRLLLALVLFFLARIFFLILNYAHFSELGFGELLRDFFIGIRFDLSVIIYFNFPVILMHIIPGGKWKEHKYYQGFIKYYFLIINSFLLFVNLGDARFFDFTLKRSTAFILKYLFESNDVPLLLPRFITDYWYVLFTWIVLTVASWYFYPENKGKRTVSSARVRKKNLLYQIVSFVVLFGLSVVGARGGTQLKPLSVIHASIYVPAGEVPLVLNTPFAIMTTYGHKTLPQKQYFPPEKCQEIYPIRHQYNYADTSFRKINVVILLLESFSREYSGYLNGYKGYMPFLDSLMQQSLLFTNAYSNALRSIDAIPSVISGIPNLMNDPFISSVYNTNSINSLAQIFNEEGYETAFFHGGNNGTMRFDAFAGMAGFQAYYGHNEYNRDNPGNNDYDGYWGIFDGPFLQYMATKLNSFKEPFFVFEFTLSSHSPYDVPEGVAQMFPETDVPMHRVVRYSDYALKKFFETASKMPWYDRTLFVILADHPGHSISEKENAAVKDEALKLTSEQIKYYKNTAGRYAIPVLYYFPGDSLKGETNTTTQQTDVMPSLLDYMKYGKPFVAFGNSVFDQETPHVAIEYLDGVFQITEGDYSLLFDGDKALSLFNNRKDPKHASNLLKKEKERALKMEKVIKAVLQQYNDRMENNRLVP